MADEQKLTKDQELRKFEADKWWDHFQKSAGYSKDYGSATIQSLILINGGAIVALLSLLSTLFSKNDFPAKTIITAVHLPFYAFAGGLLLAIVAGGLGYLNFIAIADSMPGPNGLKKYIQDGSTDDWKSRSRTVKGTMYVAIICVVLSALSFGYGTYSAFDVVSKAFK